MRRKDREITEIKKIEEILHQAKVCYLALSSDAQPYVVPMNYGYRDGVFFLHSATEGKKVDMARKNPKVCCSVHVNEQLVSAEEACGWTCRYRSVIAEGTVEFLNTVEEKTDGLNVLMKHYSGKTFDIPEDALARILIWKISVTHMTGKENQ